jgi:hypothetical protein
MLNLENILQNSLFHHIKKNWIFFLKNSVFIFRIIFLPDYGTRPVFGFSAIIFEDNECHMFAYVVVIFATIHVGFHLHLWGWFSIIGFLFPASGVDFSLDLVHILFQNWLGIGEASVSFRSTYTLDFNNSSFIMSDSENYETTFNHFLLHSLRYLCNFCPNTCSQEAILMKVSHLGVVTLSIILASPKLFK